MKRIFAEIRQAILFLTILPLAAEQSEDSTLGRSLAFFPLVGLGIGLFLAAAHLLLLFCVPPSLAVLLVLLLSVYITGALHLDGVADSADGLYGHRPREDRLRIMKDSRIGAMGVIALISLFLLKIVALGAIPLAMQQKVLIALPMIGRWMMVALAVFAPYARPEGGTGRSFVEAAGRRELLIATALTAAVLLCAFGLWGLTLLAAMHLAVSGVERYSFRRLGGITGDILGAICEWSEALFLVGCAIAYFHRS